MLRKSIITIIFVTIFLIVSIYIVDQTDKTIAHAEEEYLTETYDGVELIIPSSRIAVASADTQNIVTQFLWRDDQDLNHPLAFTRIDVFYDIFFRTYYTDVNGYLPSDCVIPLNTVPNLIVYASGIRTSVKEITSNGTEIWCMVLQNFNINAGLCVFTPTNTYSDFSKAQQISQALIFANKFAEVMHGDEINPVTAIYPHEGGSFYRRSEESIYISSQESDLDYSDWDVIMHEYGHHVSHEFGLNDSEGGRHHSNYNMADHYLNNTDDCYDLDISEAKDYAVRLAWAESWPTIFGELAQQYYAEVLTNISNVADGYYVDDLLSFEYESINVRLGESCERSIMGVLWDLFDDSGTSESQDKIHLGYQGWWNVTTGSGATTFSEFVLYFYDEYPELQSEIAKNLTDYKMATTTPVSTAGSYLNANNTPTFTWQAQGGSVNYPNNAFSLQIFNEDLTNSLTCTLTNVTQKTLTTEEWNTILSWPGEKIYVSIVSLQLSTPITGGYYSEFAEFTKQIYKTNVVNGGAIITGTYCQLYDIIEIPAEINGYPVVGIGDWAFQNKEMTVVNFANIQNIVTIGTGAFNGCPNLSIFVIPRNVTYVGDWAFADGAETGILIDTEDSSIQQTIGTGAFSNLKIVGVFEIPTSVTNIKAWAFSETSFYNKFILTPNHQINTIGEYAFYKAHLSTLILSSSINTMGTSVFGGCECDECSPTDGSVGRVGPTLYVEHSSRPSGWVSNWNAVGCPVVWGCTLSADKSYVVSVNKTSSSISNASATGGITAPFREDYTFGGWYTTSDFSGTQYTDITQAPNGTLYAKWTEKSCVAEGTMVTLADGSEVAVESLSGNEQLLVWNLLTGSYDVAPILFVDCDELSSYRVIELTFSDGTEVKVIDEHGFWCYELNEYVYLDENASSYVGYHFNKKSGDSYTSVTLVGVEIYYETTRAYSPVTYGHLCYFVNGMLSMPGGIGGLFNIFEVDATTMSYDQEAMEEDIAEYGLYTYEEFTQEVVAIPEEIFNAFNGAYLKVAIGKGLITEEEIVGLAVRYAEFF